MNLPSEKNRTSSIQSAFSMPISMKLGAPMLRVRELDQSLDFYKNSLGLKQVRKYVDEDSLEVHELSTSNSSDTLLSLKNDPKASTPPNAFAGLYHYAVLVPSRKSLASTFLAVGNTGIPYDGYADHFVSEALYLHDYEGNGIEIYADRGKERWATFHMSENSSRAKEIQRFNSLNGPLDFNSLLGVLSKDERANSVHFPEGARIGHVHLQVTNLERSVKFYNEVLALDIVANLPEIGAAFLSVGGYHHHIGLNTWNSLNGTPHKQGEAGLENFAMLVPDEKTLDKLESRFGAASVLKKNEDNLVAVDPDGIEIIFRASGIPS